MAKKYIFVLTWGGFFSPGLIFPVEEGESPSSYEESESSSYGDEGPKDDGPVFRDTILVPAKKEESLGDGARQSISLRKAENETNSALSEVIAKRRGIKVNRFGAAGSYSTLSIRGSSSNQVGIFIDGISINDPLDGGGNLEGLPKELFDSVEIYRSYTPLELGGSHIGGAINLLPRSADSAELDNSDGSIWFLRSHISSLRGGSLGVGLFLPGMLHYAKAEGSQNRYDYYDDGGTPLFNTLDDNIAQRQNEDFTSYRYTGLFSLLQAKSATHEQNLKLFVDLFTKERGIPGVIGSPLQYVRLQEERVLAKLRYEIPIGDHLLLGSSAALSTADLRLTDPKKELSFGIVRQERSARRKEISFTPVAYLLQDRITLQPVLHGAVTDLRLNQKPFAQREEIHSGLGLLYQERGVGEIFVQSKELTLKDHLHEKEEDQLLFTGFAQQRSIKKRLRNHFLRLSLLPLHLLRRLQSATATGKEHGQKKRSQKEYGQKERSQKEHGQQSRRPPFLEINAAFSYGERAPTITESYGNGQFILGNPRLSAEKAKNYSYGIGGGFPLVKTDLEFRITYFHTDVEKIILFLQNTAQTLRAENLGAASIDGIEGASQFRWQSYLLANFRFTYLQAIDKGDLPYYRGKQLPFRPRHAAELYMEGGGAGLRPFFSLHWLGSLYRDRQNSAQKFVASRDRFDVGLSYYFGKEKKDRISFLIKNLEDEYHSDVIGYPLPDRTYEIQFYKEFL